MRTLFARVAGGGLIVALICGGLAAYGQKNPFDADSIIAGPVLPQLIARQFSFTEGPAVDRRGNLYFTDQPNNQIWEYDTASRLTLFMDSAGRSNGMYFDRKGNLISCADEHNQLWSISPRKKIKVLLSTFQGHLLNGPNDLWIDRHGGIYFTDPYYQRSYWTRTRPDIDGERVYYLPKGKKEAIVVADDLEKPNGIVGTPDGQYLYVADIRAGKTYKYRINKDGTLSGKALFVTQGSDGMTLDVRGDLYLCGNGVTVYNAAGQKVGYIPIPEDWTGNICFGGRERKTLFITASKSIYKLPMRVAGVE